MDWGYRESVPLLVETLGDENHHVAWAAVNALANIGEPAAPALKEALLEHESPEVRRHAASSLALMGPGVPRGATRALAMALGDPCREVIWTSAAAFYQIGADAEEELPHLLESLESGDEDLRTKAISNLAALALLSSGSASEEIDEVLKGLRPQQTRHAVSALAGLAADGEEPDSFRLETLAFIFEAGESVKNAAKDLEICRVLLEEGFRDRALEFFIKQGRLKTALACLAGLDEPGLVEKVYHQALEQYVDDPAYAAKIHHTFAKYYFSEGKYEKAAESYRALYETEPVLYAYLELEIEPLLDTYLEAVFHYAELDLHEKAEETYQKALRRHEDNISNKVKIHHAIAEYYAGRELHEKAADSYYAAYKIEPNMENYRQIVSLYRRIEDREDEKAAGGARLRRDFDCTPSSSFEVMAAGGEGTEEEPARFYIDFGTSGGRHDNGFFLFSLEDVAGKTVRVTIRNGRAGRTWSTLNPVWAWATADDLDDPELYAARPTPVPEEGYEALPRAENGPLLPVTRREGEEFQSWHYIPDAAALRGGGFEFRHTFPDIPEGQSDSVVVAMRVPYTPGYHETYMDSLREREKHGELFHVHEVGRSSEGRPLHVVEIGENSEEEKEKEEERPVIMLYAREHPDEHDTSWVAQGAIEYLLGEEGESLRREFTVLVIPLLDPDGAAENVYEGIIHTFHDSFRTQESLAWAGFAREWIEEGNRLDIVINLHNVESNEMPHLLAPQMHPEGDKVRNEANWTLHREHITPLFEEEGYEVAPDTWGKGVSLTRFGGWLGARYGTLHMPYETNSQAPGRHLSLKEIQEMGELMVKSATRFLSTGEHAEELVQKIDDARRKRRELVERYGQLAELRRRNVLSYESFLQIMPSVERDISERDEVPQWFKPVYENERDSSERPPASEG